VNMMLDSDKVDVNTQDYDTVSNWMEMKEGGTLTFLCIERRSAIGSAIRSFQHGSDGP
jgi:hypothetical protein